MLIIGGAQTASLLLTVLRVKVVAVLLGPTGIGLLGLYNNLVSTVSGGAGLGIFMSGTREIAAARDDARARTELCTTLLVAGLVQGVAAGFVFWIAAVPLARWMLGDVAFAGQIGLLGAAVALTLLTLAQRAMLQGFERIDTLARVIVLGGVVGTVTGIAAAWLLGATGLVALVILQPLATMLAGLFMVGGLAPSPLARVPVGRLLRLWWRLLAVGAPIMAGALTTVASALLARVTVVHGLGLEAAGHFAAVWSIAAQYSVLLYGAMSAGYFPRLSGVIHDRAAALGLMHQQAQLGLAVGAPAFTLLIGLAPWVIPLLYSGAFGPAVSLLQWLLPANMLQLAGWPLSLAILASGRSRLFFLVEAVRNLGFLVLLWWTLPLLGLDAVALAFATSQGLHFVALTLVGNRLFRFRWHGRSAALLATHSALALGTLLATRLGAGWGAATAILLGLGGGVLGLRVALENTASRNPLVDRFADAFARFGWPVRRPEGRATTAQQRPGERSSGNPRGPDS